eukprot:CAMPEP_0197538068 /NCGR_PEP_ID=MMETSP1318-20131121/58741_1 /TAXON_ID=552666 /ORGANISM="Partenskyella glossopodia, Strain RCC365" /LENGTH=338 /DNA_ID=CAMNT_0043096389 /DNA_START=169 /DNA_END=1185 /DNA_ORIENTATION=-
MIRSAIESSYLDEAQIVFCTLSTAGSEMMLSRVRRAWDYVLIDEAAQSVELSTLIALQHRVHRCVLIGDPEQLPAVVNITSGNAALYQQSMFERFKRGGHPVQMLSTQYRMHPKISAFPSKHFYGSRLRDGENVRSPTWNKLFHTDSRFRPMQFFDVHSTDSRDKITHSAYNTKEIDFVISLLRNFVEKWVNPPPKNPVPGVPVRLLTVGIITPYAEQRRRIERKVARLTTRDNQTKADGSASAWKSVALKVATVDGFQGGEKDVIIFSCVRSNRRGGIGFLADIRRMNVALTRARHACWVVGNSSALSVNPHWRSFLDHCKEHGSFVSSSAASDIMR